MDAALVHHYFGTKDEVFAAAIELSFEPAPGRPGACWRAAGTPSASGWPASSCGIWENPATRAPLLAIMRSALTHEAAAKVLRGFILRRLLERIAGELDVPDPKFRAELAASHMVGIAILRYVIKVEPMASADPEEIVAMVAPTLQRYLTDRLPAGPRKDLRPAGARGRPALRTARPDLGSGRTLEGSHIR